MGRRFDPDRAHFANIKLFWNMLSGMNLEMTLKRMAQSLLIVGPLASLAVSPGTNFDPINLIKLLIITPIAFFCFCLFLSSFKNLRKRLDSILCYSLGLFLFAMFSTLLFSGAPFSQQIWGTFGRNTGLLTYLALILIFVGTAIIQKIDFYHKLVNSLLITSLPMTAYCLIQYAGIDPIAWSEKNVFGTLGNINFSSAFFGFSSICALGLLFEKRFSFGIKVGIFLLILIDMFIVLSTGSIQGFMIFVAGAGLTGFLYLRSNAKIRILSVPYAIISFIGVVFTVLGLSNKGPLAKFLFAPSIVFRTDYWHAGWRMTLDHPFFGVGMDSYGDWYRSSRGMISTLRTGPERVANTAHNIFLDLSSNGGFPLLIAFLAINFVALRAAVIVLKRNSNFQPYFVAILSTWFGYLIFSGISINQVGVGIWGWLFTGALIGYEAATRGPSSNLQSNLKKISTKKNSSLAPAAGILGFVGFALGFLLAYIPFNADVQYRNATKTAAMDQIIKSTKVLGSTAYHTELALDTALKNNFQIQIDLLTRQLVSSYPLDFMGWRSLQILPSATVTEKLLALEKIQELDPFNPDLPKS